MILLDTKTETVPAGVNNHLITFRGPEIPSRRWRMYPITVETTPIRSGSNVRCRLRINNVTMAFIENLSEGAFPVVAYAYGGGSGQTIRVRVFGVQQGDVITVNIWGMDEDAGATAPPFSIVPPPTGGLALRFATRVVAASNSNLNGATADYICTGTADEVTINQAIADCKAAAPYGRVELLDGDYYLAGAVNAFDDPFGIDASGYVLEGQGPSTVLHATTAAKMISCQNPAILTIRNLYCDGAHVSGAVIDVCGVKQTALVEDVWIRNGTDHGLFLCGNDTVARRVFVTGCTGDGIHFAATGGNRGGAEWCVVTNNGGHGFFVPGTWTKPHLLRCESRDNAGNGADWNAGGWITKSEFSGNLIGIHNGGADVNIHDCDIKENYQEGIRLEGGVIDGRVTDNDFEGNGRQTPNTYSQLLLTGSPTSKTTSTDVLGNNFRKGSYSPKYGLELATNSTLCWYDGNDFYNGGTTADYIDLGTANVQGVNRGTAGVIGLAHNILSATHSDTFAADVPADAEVLTWSAANNRWESKPAAGGSGSKTFAFFT